MPVSILGWLVGAFFYIFGLNISRVSTHYGFIFEWYIYNDGWLYRWMDKKGWGGFSIGNNVFLSPIKDLKVENRLFLHEQEHCFQQYKFGIFFLLFYLLESLRIFFFDREKHSYLDNRFEREARKAAGQRVDIPREDWPQGPTDHWVWW